MCNSYQGWSNYPTWAVSLWINNEEGSYNYWNDKAQELANEHGKDEAKYKLAEELKEEFANPDIFLDKSASMYDDILQWAMEQVDWFEIAESMLEDIEVELDEEESEAEEE